MDAKNREYRKVIRYIRGRLASGKLSIGDKLPTERELSEKLELSRSSVREALRIMENMGILESRQGSGNFIAGNIEKGLADALSMMVLMKRVGYTDISQLQRCLEIQALELALGRITPGELEELNTIVSRMEKTKRRGSHALSKQFHFFLFEASGNQLLIQLAAAAFAACEREVFRIVVHLPENGRMEIIKSHRELYRSLAEKDLKRGINAITRNFELIENRPPLEAELA